MFIYLISNQLGLFKVGVSKNPNKRIKSMETGNPDDLIILYVYNSKKSYVIEKTLHRLYQQYHVKLEWFSLPTNEVENFLINCKKIDDNLKYLEENKI
jgi:hypothetical protein